MTPPSASAAPSLAPPTPPGGRIVFEVTTDGAAVVWTLDVAPGRPAHLHPEPLGDPDLTIRLDNQHVVLVS